MTQKVTIDGDLGYARFGAFSDKGAEAPNCGPGSLAIGRNTSAKAIGAFAFGSSDAKDGVSAEGVASSANGVAVQNSHITAKGVAAKSSGSASNNSTILADGNNATAGGSATNNSRIEATAEGARAEGISADSSFISAKGKNSNAQGDANNSGVIQSLGNRASSSGRADGGLVSAESDDSIAKGEAKQSGKIIARGKLSSASGTAGDGSGAPALILSGGESSRVVARVSSGSAEVSGLGSSLLCEVHGGSMKNSQDFSDLVGWVGPGENMEPKYPYSLTRGRNVGNETLYGGAVGEHGTLDSVLPAQALFAGTKADSQPAMLLRVDARGDQPLATGLASSWEAMSGFKELFEWEDGNLTAEDRDGFFVALRNGKLVKATGEAANEGANEGEVPGGEANEGEATGEGANKGEATGEGANEGGAPGGEANEGEAPGGEANEGEAAGEGAVIGVSSSYGGFQAGRRLPIETDRLGRPKFEKDYSYGLNAALLKAKKNPYIGGNVSEEELPALLKGNGLPEDAEILPCYFVKTKSVTRNRRAEQPVTLLGKVVVRDEGLCEVGSSVDCKNGLAVPGTRWHVLRRVSGIAVEILW